MEGYEILKRAAKALDNKKAVDLTAIKITEVTVIGDYFLLATATSSTHVRALAETVEEELEKEGVRPNHIEGRATGWILLDYADVIVHIMDAKTRDFYGLEHTWNDGIALEVEELLK